MDKQISDCITASPSPPLQYIIYLSSLNMFVRYAAAIFAPFAICPIWGLLTVA